MFNLLVYNFFLFYSSNLVHFIILKEQMSKMRKRSFTNYQSSALLEQELLDQVFQQRKALKIQICNTGSQENSELTGFGMAKTKKAKLFSKVQKFSGKASRTSTEGVNFSTIQSLKKQIVALECDQITSYRIGSTKDESKQAEKQKSSENISQIQAIIRKFQVMKKLAVADKFQRRFLLFKTTRIQIQSKTQRSSVKKDISSRKSDRIPINNEKIILDRNNGQKIIERREQYLSSKSKNTLSLTARKFYDKKSTHSRTMTESSLKIYDRQKSIKKLRIGNRPFSESMLALQTNK